MTSERDRYILDYARLKAEMRGINPKLSIYKELEKKEKFLLEKIGGIGHIVKEQKKYREYRLKLAKVVEVSVEARPKCKIEGCVKLVRTKGKKRWGNRCLSHHKKKTPIPNV